MKLSEDGPFEFKGTSLHLRLWESENGKESPVLIVEAGRGTSLSENRIDLAKDISQSLGTTPDKLRWYEQRADGSLQEYKFSQMEHRPYANDLSMQEYRAAEKAGTLKPDILTHSHAPKRDVSPEERRALETHLNDPLESYEQKQKREFADMTISR